MFHFLIEKTVFQLLGLVFVFFGSNLLVGPFKMCIIFFCLLYGLLRREILPVYS